MRRDPALSFGHRRSLRPIGPGPGRGTCASALPKLTMRVRLPSPAPHHIRAPVGGSARYAGEAQIGRRARSVPDHVRAGAPAPPSSPSSSPSVWASWRPMPSEIRRFPLARSLQVGQCRPGAAVAHALQLVGPAAPCVAPPASRAGATLPPIPSTRRSGRVHAGPAPRPCPGLTVQYEADRLLGSSPASCPGGDPERRGPTGRNDRQTPPLDGRQVLSVVAISL
jgi:hypothetical protein